MVEKFWKETVGDLSPRTRRWISAIVVSGLLAAPVGAAGFLWTTPECTVRKLWLLEFDRTQDCLKHGTQPGADMAVDVKAVPEQHDALQKHLVIETWPAGHREGEQHDASGLALIEAESESLRTMPPGTFAHVWSGRFTRYWQDDRSKLTVSRSMRAEYFEIERRNDGETYLVGFVRGDVAKFLDQGSDTPAELDVYARRYQKADVVVAVPLRLLESVGQDEVEFPNKKIIPVLELKLKSP